MTIIREARIIAAGDPAAGIQDHQVVVDHIDLDLGLFEPKDVASNVESLCRAFVLLGEAATGEKCSVHLGVEGDRTEVPLPKTMRLIFVFDVHDEGE